MKLGTETNSLINHLHSRMVEGQPEPQIGMGATILSWSDRYAATVTAWDVKKMIVTIRRDTATRIDKNGMSESQEWTYEPDPNGTLYTFRQDKRSGAWNEVAFKPETGRWSKTGGYGLRIGVRNEFFDFSF